MSMPFRIITCDTCDFQAFSSCIWGSYDYVSSDGTRLGVNRTFGWCYSCHDIRPVEDLTDEDELKNDINISLQKIADIKSTELLGRFLQLLGKDRWHISSLKEDKKNNQRRLKLLQERITPPKCLICSSAEVQIIHIPNPQGENVDKITELRHPNCGGNLLVHNSKWWINVVLRSREFDLNGNFIQEVNPN